MHKSILVSLALIAGGLLSLLSLGAQATPVNVNLQACTITSGNWCDSGSSTYTNSGITFDGWQLSGSSSPAVASDLTYKNGGANEIGLGVVCLVNGPKCGQHEINLSYPGQYISASIPTHFTSLSIGVQSVDSDGGNGFPEIAFIYGAICADNGTTCLGATPLAFYSFNGTNKTWTFNFTQAQLSAFSYLWISPLGYSGGPETGPDANILLGSFSYNVSVPEPAVLGMFGLGILLIGVFVGLRRRNQH